MKVVKVVDCGFVDSGETEKLKFKLLHAAVSSCHLELI